MENIGDIIKDCKKELDIIHIPYDKNATFKINNRLQKTWGKCKKKNNKYIVEISGKVFNNVKTPQKTIKTILIHEMLHTCENCMNHGIKWKTYAEKVNKTYGYNIKRTNSIEEYGCESLMDSTAKHLIQCKKCGQKYYRSRESELTKHPSRYKCGVCKGALEKVY